MAQQRSLLGAFFAFICSGSLWALTCHEVRTLTGVYTRLHYSYSTFDNELSERTLDNFLKALDPGKTYFLKPDVEEFRKKYATQLDDLIMGGNCAAIDDIMNVYGRRLASAQELIKKKLIDTEHKFDVEEYLDVDFKKLDYAADQEDGNDRWRRRIKYAIMQMQETLPDIKQVRSKLHKRYDLVEKRSREMTSSEVLAIFLNAFASALDPHTDYMSAETLEDFRIQTRLSLEGIGAVLRPEDGFTVIQSLVPGGAAAKTGLLKVNDKIIEVAQGENGKPVDVVDMELQEVVKLIRGTRDTVVMLTIVREEGGKTQRLKVPVTRSQIQLTDRQAKSEVIVVDHVDGQGAKKSMRVGLVRLPSFYIDFEGRQQKVEGYRSSSADTRREIQKLRDQKIDAMIVDLRNNGGGSLDESVAVAGLFLDRGPIVQIKGRDAKSFSQDDTDAGMAYDGPLVVLINRQSASASEIFAGAIQDYGRGLVVGDRHTFGKGTVQNLNDISEKLGAVKITISKFYRPLGASTQLRGVESDIVFPDLFDEYEFGEKFYDYAMPWDKIEPAKIQRVDLIASDRIANLRGRSETRVAKDPGFDETRKAIDEFRKKEAERTRISLKRESSSTPTPSSVPTPTPENDPEDDASGPVLPLDKDPHLQESVRVAADLVLQGTGLPLGNYVFPALASSPASKSAVRVVEDDKKGKKAGRSGGTP